jgi:hypothetical protein
MHTLRNIYISVYQSGSYQLQGAKQKVHQLRSTGVLDVLLQFGLQGAEYTLLETVHHSSV